MTTQTEQQTEMLIKLSNVENDVEVQDMNYIFHYNRVSQPDTNLSDLFSLHYREQQWLTWETCRGLLSEKFTIARTEMVIQQIQSNLQGQLENEHHYRSGTSVKSTFTLSGYQIDIEDDSDMDKILFKLITNIDAGVDMISTSNLSFNIINGFSGNLALHLNYGILKTFRTTVGNDERIVPINNVFILDKFTKHLVHDDHLNISIEDVANVQENMSSRFDSFRQISISQEFLEEFEEKFPKKFGKKFLSMFNSLPDNMKNFYYASYIWSVLLDAERKIDLEIKLRAYVNTKLSEAIRALDLPIS